MCLRDEIRDLGASHKFDGQSRQGRRRSAMLYLVSMDGGIDGTYASQDEEGFWMATSDRWLMIEDSQGFFEARRCKSANDAASLAERYLAGQG